MKTAKKNQVTPERLMQFGFAYAPPLIITAAVSNKVFDSLESGSKTVDQTSKETGASARGLRMLMNALVGLELLKKDRHQKYSLTPESAAFLVSNKPGALAGFSGAAAASPRQPRPCAAANCSLFICTTLPSPRRTARSPSSTGE